MTPSRLYKPHLFKSVVHPGLWVCVSRRLSTKPGRAIEPVPYVPVLYGTTPAKAYKRWLYGGVNAVIFGRKVRLRPSRVQKGWYAYLVRDLPKAGANGETQAPLPLCGTFGRTPAKAYSNLERMYV